jgi:hypothetical protein
MSAPVTRQETSDRKLPTKGEIWKERRIRPHGPRHVYVVGVDNESVRIEAVEKLREHWFRRLRGRTTKIRAAEFLQRFTFLEGPQL